MKQVDVVIVGACTAGTYFASLLAKEGLKVLVIDKDKEEDLSKRLDIIHFTTDSYKEFGIEESKPGDEEFVRYFNVCYSKSALDNHLKTNKINVSVLHLPLFIKKLRKMAINNHAEFLFQQTFDHLIYDENDKITGIMTKENLQINARLVVDASGISSVVRRQIKDPYMETFEIGPRDKFYVLLKYVKLKDENIKITDSTSWQYYKGWIAPQHSEGGAIIGVGANLSFDYAKTCMQRFEDSIPLPEYELQYEEMGCTPYRRPPYSFVCDGFMVIGDAACLTKPFNGEGIPSAWNQLYPSVKIIKEALKNNHYPTVDDLWEINTIYQRNEGGEYASLRPLLIGVVDTTKKDNDYLFKKGIYFRSDDEEEHGSTIFNLIKGVITFKFSLHGFISLLDGFNKANKIKKLYKNYPSSPKEYFTWKKKADKLWKKIGSMADKCK